MPKKPATKRSQKAELNRNRIYETALGLISSRGYDNTSIQDIVGAAGISIGTFYHYFKSKHGILEENFRRADCLFSDFFETELPAGGTVERILLYMDRYARLAHENGVDLTSQLYTPHNRLFIKRGRAMQTCLVAIIEEGQARGELAADLGADQICDFIFIAARGIVFDWCLKKGRGDIRKELRSYFTRLLRAFEPA
ncbi:MAG TPA: TetR/AcrR family transcriptional regulator [Spirochaetia bacterium]|nr:TetR/AcrR family transcriptional regulator [Spirochaetia bacterium]HRZ65933.1 TetR/AcrR family transcriptional regulator [Spirochaetia bacterium]